MAKIRDVIARVDESKPNAFTEAQKVRWLAQLDGKIAADVMLMNVADLRQLEYQHPIAMDWELLVSFPHDDIYDLWLMAQIDMANGETDKYLNSMEAYNASFDNFVCWFASVYEPAQGYIRSDLYV